MGTNYYLTQSVCPHCGRGDEPRHIGKSSAGWCFALHVYPGEGINDLDDWERLWATPGSIIKDEYGKMISISEMKQWITERSWKGSKEHFDYAANYAIEGPNNLARRKIDRWYCIGHGAGTWDLCVGDFS